MTDTRLHGIESDDEGNTLSLVPNTDGEWPRLYQGGIDDPMVQFQIVIDRIADIERKINKIDETITQTKTFIEKISDTAGPIIEKLSNNVFLKGFIS
jgi:hypothetical protein